MNLRPFEIRGSHYNCHYVHITAISKISNSCKTFFFLLSPFTLFCSFNSLILYKNPLIHCIKMHIRGLFTKFIDKACKMIIQQNKIMSMLERYST